MKDDFVIELGDAKEETKQNYPEGCNPDGGTAVNKFILPPESC